MKRNLQFSNLTVDIFPVSVDDISRNDKQDSEIIKLTKFKMGFLLNR